jgi:hypothetical protein
MTVEQYSTKFIELARFAANLIPDEESKAERFKKASTLASRKESYASRSRAKPG